MDVPVTPASVLNIQQIHLQQESRQGAQQQSPFAKGQLLQGTVTGKSADNIYQLLIGSKQLQAHSNAPLRIGQQLDLQVSTTSPRVEMQVVTDPITRNIASTLRGFDTQKFLFSSLSQLSAESSASGLGNRSAATLEAITQTLARLNVANRPATSVSGASLLTPVIQALRNGETALPSTLAARLGTVVHTVAEAVHNTPQGPQAQYLLQTLTQEPSLLLAVTDANRGVPVQALQQLLTTSGQVDSQSLNLAQQLIAYFRETPSLLPSRETFALLSLALTPSLASATSAPEPNGQQLQHLLDRLGVNMEALFLANRGEEAARTLKSALLETQQLAAQFKQGEQVGQLLQTIELYQMLQLRLAGEALLFLPLPLPFLDQGYMLIDQAPQKQQQQAPGSEPLRYTLHLTLEGLGNLRIELEQVDGRVDIRFFSEDREKMTFLREHREELGQWLTALDLGATQFFLGAEEPTASLLQKISAVSSGMINTRA